MSNSNRQADEADSGIKPNRPVQLSDEDELESLISGANIALIEFYTEGCGICQSMEPVISNLAREMNIPIGMVNPRDDPPLVDRFDVRSVPLFVLFVDGEAIGRLADGFVSGDELAAWIKEQST